MILVALASAILFVIASFMTSSHADPATGRSPLALLVIVGWPVGMLALVLSLFFSAPDIVKIGILLVSTVAPLGAIISVMKFERKHHLIVSKHSW